MPYQFQLPLDPPAPKATVAPAPIAVAPAPEPFFTEDDIIHVYTIDDALADGVLFDARKLGGEAGEMSRREYKCNPVYLTVGVHELVDRAARNPRTACDWPGIWWDILRMARPAVAKAAREAERHGNGKAAFHVLIVGAGRQRKHTIQVALNGDGLTFMLPGED